MSKPPAPGQPLRRNFFARWQFHRFQSRLLALILLLVFVLQALVFAIVSSAANRSALRASSEALQLTASSLQTIMRARESNLRKYARLLASDYALKTLVSEGDQETMLSAFGSYQKRLDADWMLLLDMDGNIMADTMQSAGRKDAFAHPALLNAARQSADAESSGILFVNGLAYQMVLVPLQAPEQVAWVGIGFVLTDKLASELEKQTHTQISLTWQSANPRQRTIQILASTLNPEQRKDLAQVSVAGQMRAQRMELAGAEFVSMALLLNRGGDGVLQAVLQRSLDEALAGYHAQRWQLLAIFALSTLLATAVGVLIARRVTQPVARLASAARALAGGQYQLIGDIGQQDEFGALATAFDKMVRGLQERDQVRSLLGKVVSPQVAEELLSRKIELGGEEREVTLLFSDIRGFTNLSEGCTPSAILAMLNTYLTRMSAIIDQQHGVVDKYIGDAVMALFGAPVNLHQHAQCAVQAALLMVAAMPRLNQSVMPGGWAALEIGIGIHSGIVVAGNVGSETRLNYTVLGDNVNLASRLEGLCKKYHVQIVVSAATRQQCPQIAFRELDLVRVKGRREAVSIYQALAPNDELSASQRALLQQHEAALVLYRQASFSAALQAFLALPEDAVSQLYRARCARFLKHPPAADWDAIETLDEK